ncbi:MAG: ROK family protein [Armatimonadota bacterium]
MDRAFLIGLDIGATDVKVALWDLEANALSHFFKMPSQACQGPEACLLAAGEACEQATRQMGLPLSSVLAIGVGIFGPVDRPNGVLEQTPLFPQWRRVAVTASLSERLGVPVHLENDANLAVYGEWWQGAAKGCPITVGLTLGTGIGGGIVIDGEIIQGATGYAGELGHISVAADGPLCPCGNTGCLGRMASATALVRRYRERLQEAEAPYSTAREIAEAARQGDALCAAVVTDVAEDLARAILVLVDCLNPHCVVLCGGMSQMGEQLLQPIRAWIAAKSFENALRSLRIVPGAFTVWSGAVGAAGWAMRCDTRHR